MLEANKDKGGGGIGDAIGSVLSGGKKAVFGALDALDTPRAALLSFATEAADLIDPDGDGSFDFDDFIRKTRDNYSFGEFLNDEVSQTNDWNPIVRGVAGLTGDILTDPLTWLAPGAKIGTTGAKGAGAALARATDDDLLRAGLTREARDEAVARVGKARTASVLSDAERRAAGFVDEAGNVERGIYWNAPGTGRVGRRLRIDKAVDKVTGGRYGLSAGDRTYAKQVRLGGGKRLSKTQEMLMKPVAKAGNKITTTMHAVNGIDNDFKAWIRSGDPEQAMKGFAGLDASSRGRLQDKRFEAEFGSIAGQLVHDAKKAGVSMRDLHLAAAGDGPAIARIQAKSPDIVTRARSFFDDTFEQANARVVEHGGVDFLQYKDDYTFRVLTDEARAHIKGAGDSPWPKRGKKASFEKARKYNPGDKLLGEELLDPKAHPRKWSVEEQINDILQRNGGHDGWFVEDASVTFPLYAKMLGRRVGNEVTAAVLTQRGLGEYAFGYTARGARVHEARKLAAKRAETSRRRANVAQAAEDDAARTLGAGVDAANAAGDAARQATRQAEQASDDAVAAAVEAMSAPPESVLIQQEYAEHLATLAGAQQDVLQRIIRQGAGEIDQTNLGIAALRIEAESLATARSEELLRLRTLVKERDELWEQVSEASALGHTITDANDQIREMNDLIDLITRGHDSGGLRRSAAEIAADLDAILRHQRSLGGKLRWAQDPEEIRALENQLETARAMRRALNHESATGRIISDEDAILWGDALTEIDLQRARLQKAIQDAEEMGYGRAAQALAESEALLPSFAPEGLLRNIDGGTTFYHGTRNPMDLVSGSRDDFQDYGDFLGELDSGLGLHVSSNFDYAEVYARRGPALGGNGVLDDGYTVEFQVRATPDEVLVYPKDGYRLDWVENGPRGWGPGRGGSVNEPGYKAAKAQAAWQFGTHFGWAKTQLLDDLYTTAWRAGAFGRDDLHRILELDHVFDPEDADIFLDRLDEAIEGGESFIEALDGLIAGGPLDEFTEEGFGQMAADMVRREAEMYDGLWVSPDRAGIRQALLIEQRLHDKDLYDGILDAFKAEHPNVKVIQYDHERGGMEYIFMDTDRVKVTKMTEQSTGRELPPDFRAYDTEEDFYLKVAKDRAQVTQDLRREIDEITYEGTKVLQERAHAVMDEISDTTLRADHVAAKAEANTKRLTALERKLAKQKDTLKADVLEALQEEAALRTRANEAYAEGDRIWQGFIDQRMQEVIATGDTAVARRIDEARIEAHNARQIAVLEANYNQALADRMKWDEVVSKWEARSTGPTKAPKGRKAKRKAFDWDGNWDTLSDKVAEQNFHTALDRGLSQFGANTLLPEDMVEALTAATRLKEPGALRKVLSIFDGVQNLWKGYATTSPGFLNRNLMGGVFNNFLADLDPQAYKHYRRLAMDQRAAKGGVVGRVAGAYPSSKGDVWAEAYEAARTAGILTGGQSVGEVAARLGHGMSLNPLTTDFAPVRLVRKGSEGVENFLRGSLFMDVYVKTGGDVDAAIAAVNKYHFDYDDLSAVERSVMRRLVPFYTWTRKNLPLQIEMMARNPKAYNRFTQAKNNIEFLSAEEESVPGYFEENFGIRLPWSRQGGNVYYLPDLPFANMAEMLEPNQVVGNLSPFIKTPFELWAGKQAWQDIPFNDKPVPVSPFIQAIPGLMPALEQINWATRNANGEWVMKDRHMHAITNWMPTLGQARRLLPAEAKYQQRALTSWLSFFGAGLRTNTAAEKQNAEWRKYFDLKKKLGELEDLGYLEPAYQYPEQTPLEQAQAPARAMANLADDYVAAERSAENEELLAFG